MGNSLENVGLLLKDGKLTIVRVKDGQIIDRKEVSDEDAKTISAGLLLSSIETNLFVNMGEKKFLITKISV